MCEGKLDAIHLCYHYWTQCLNDGQEQYNYLPVISSNDLEK